MLFDEPTSALDPELVGEVLRRDADLAARGMTMIVVTREIGFAREVADRWCSWTRESWWSRAPPLEVINNPQHERTQAFLSPASRRRPRSTRPPSGSASRPKSSDMGSHCGT